MAETPLSSILENRSMANPLVGAGSLDHEVVRNECRELVRHPALSPVAHNHQNAPRGLKGNTADRARGPSSSQTDFPNGSGERLADRGHPFLHSCRIL